MDTRLVRKEQRILVWLNILELYNQKIGEIGAMSMFYEEIPTPHKKKKKKRKFEILAKGKDSFVRNFYGDDWFTYRKYATKKARLDAFNCLKSDELFDYKISD